LYFLLFRYLCEIAQTKAATKAFALDKELKKKSYQETLDKMKVGKHTW